MTRLTIAFVLVVGLLLFVGFPSVFGLHQLVTRSVPSSSSSSGNMISSEYTPHAPIVISSNDDFVSQDWPGSGTESDPFLIAGLLFTSSLNDACIRIQNTSVHFKISHCYIRMDGTKFGTIVLERVANAVIEDSVLLFAGIGISLETCTSITMASLMLNYSVVTIENSSDIVLEDSSIHGGPGDGVSITNSNFVAVRDVCITMVTASGIYLENNDNATIVDNYLKGNSDYQMFIAKGSSNLIYGNTFIESMLSECVKDDGQSNQWDDGVSLGNAYSDYSGESVYLIPGTAKSIDRFPRGIGTTKTYEYTFPIKTTEPLDSTASTVYMILILSLIWGCVGIVSWYAWKTKNL